MFFFFFFWPEIELRFNNTFIFFGEDPGVWGRLCWFSLLHAAWLKTEPRTKSSTGLDLLRNPLLASLLPLTILTIPLIDNKKSICALVPSRTKYGITVKEQSAAENRTRLWKTQSEADNVSLGFPALEGRQTVFTLRLEGEGENKWWAAKKREWMGLERGLEPIERDSSGARAATGHKQQRGDARWLKKKGGGVGGARHSPHN